MLRLTKYCIQFDSTSFMEILNQIKRAIAAGKTDRALELLLEHTEQTNSPRNRDVLLLSGQYKQWKREKSLGAQQSDTELRRIEMAIMDILDEKTRAGTTTAAPVAPRTTVHPRATPPTGIPSPSGPKKFWKPWMGGVAVFLGLFLLLLWIGEDETDASTANSGETTTVISNPNDPAESEIFSENDRSPEPSQTSGPGAAREGNSVFSTPGQTVKFIEVLEEGDRIVFRENGAGEWVEELVNPEGREFVALFDELERSDQSISIREQDRGFTLRIDFATSKVYELEEGGPVVIGQIVKAY